MGGEGQLHGASTGRIGACGKCGSELPLRFAGKGEEAALWLCAACGARYCAVLDASSDPDLRRNIRLAPLRFHRHRLPPPPQVSAQFIAERLAKQYDGPERRADPRRSIAAPVAAIPLDDHFLPAGEPFMGMAHNISRGGIALIHTRSVTVPYLGLELTLDETNEIRAAIRIVRCRAVGLFYEIAGPFVVRIA